MDGHEVEELEMQQMQADFHQKRPAQNQSSRWRTKHLNS